MKKNRVLIITLFILATIFLYFYGGKIPYMLLNVIFSLVAISFIYTLIVYFRFKFTQEIDKKLVMKGDKVNFIFKITNEDLLMFPYIKVTFCGADTIFACQFVTKSFSLLPFAIKTFSFELECKYRGNYEMGIKSIEIEDFLGIFKFPYKLYETKYITVYPRIVFLDSFRLRTNFESETNSMLDTRYEDMTTISDIRNYSYGDSFKKIHWKLTAKTKELKVKNFQCTSETSAIIVLDLKTNPFSIELNTIIEDKIIEAVVAVIHYCLSNWIPITFVYYYNGELITMEAKNPLDFDEIYKILSKITFKEKVSVKDILDVFLKENVNRANFVIFTSNIDYSLYNQLYKAKFAGNDVSLIYTSPSELVEIKDPEIENVLSHLTELGISHYEINISDDIKTVLER